MGRLASALLSTFFRKRWKICRCSSNTPMLTEYHSSLPPIDETPRVCQNIYFLHITVECQLIWNQCERSNSPVGDVTQPVCFTPSVFRYPSTLSARCRAALARTTFTQLGTYNVAAQEALEAFFFFHLHWAALVQALQHAFGFY